MKALKLALVASAALCAMQVHALTVNVTNTAHSAVAGAVEYDFETPAPPAGFGTYSDLSKLVTGSLSGVFAQPTGSEGYYLSVGTSGAQPLSQTLTFGSAGASYFGLLWGSPDTYNTLIVTTNNGMSTYDGTLIMPGANGNQGVSGYANFFADSGEYIKNVKWESTSNAFETDNHAVIAVPEPETSTLMLAGLAAVGFIARRRRAV